MLLNACSTFNCTEKHVVSENILWSIWLLFLHCRKKCILIWVLPRTCISFGLFSSICLNGRLTERLKIESNYCESGKLRWSGYMEFYGSVTQPSELFFLTKGPCVWPCRLRKTDMFSSNDVLVETMLVVVKYPSLDPFSTEAELHIHRSLSVHT